MFAFLVEFFRSSLCGSMYLLKYFGGFPVVPVLHVLHRGRGAGGGVIPTAPLRMCHVMMYLGTVVLPPQRDNPTHPPPHPASPLSLSFLSQHEDRVFAKWVLTRSSIFLRIECFLSSPNAPLHSTRAASASITRLRVRIALFCTRPVGLVPPPPLAVFPMLTISAYQGRNGLFTSSQCACFCTMLSPAHSALSPKRRRISRAPEIKLQQGPWLL